MNEAIREALPPLPAVATEYAGVEDAIRDALLGWQYIRRYHGDLYGVGWDRVEQKLIAAEAAAIKAATEMQERCTKVVKALYDDWSYEQYRRMPSPAEVLAAIREMK